MNKPFLVGLTGGIGSGKSYVSNLFKTLCGVEVYTADDVVKYDIIKRPNIKEAVTKEFGEESYLSDGNVNRYKFKDLLFTDVCALHRMNAIIIPELIDDVNKWSLDKKGNYVLVECATIFENDLELMLFDYVVGVVSPMKIRIERLLKRGLTIENIFKVMKVQMDDDKIREYSQYVIENDSDNSKLEQQIKSRHQFLNKLCQK
jgi:dephospho-CoA kinase